MTTNLKLVLFLPKKQKKIKQFVHKRYRNNTSMEKDLLASKYSVHRSSAIYTVKIYEYETQLKTHQSSPS